MRIERVFLYMFLAFLGFWLLKRTACGWSGDWSNGGGGIRGSGKSVSQERSVGDFDRITSDGALELRLRQGETASVRIEADDNLQEKITTTVDGGRLTISMRSGFSISQHSKITVFVTVRDLKELSFTGVGSVVCDGDLRLKKLEMNLSGVGEMDLKGSCEDAELVNSGAGNIAASGFVCQKLSIVNSGVGNISARAEREIKVENSGVGNVEWSGAAQTTNFESSGIGKIIKLDSL